MTSRFVADTVLTCDADFQMHRPGAIDVDEDGRIEWVGPAAEAPARDVRREQNLDGILLPGLVNTHCHSPMTLFRGTGEDLVLNRWLKQVLWPREAHLTSQDVYWGMTLAAGELLRFGVTTSCEMYYYSRAIVDAVVDAGARVVVTPPVMLATGMEHLGTWQEQLAANESLVEPMADAHERVEVGLAAHAAYTLPLDALEGIGRSAAERDLLLQIHVAESRHEASALEREQQRSVPQILTDMGFFDARRVLAAHSVWLSDADLALYAENDVAVAHCPQSNTKLASGIARVTDMLDAGLRVGLGTDGPASNNDLDLWEEMRLAPLLQRARTLDASVMPAPEAICLATRGGASALGRSDIGVLEEGRWADLVRLETADTAFVPVTEDADLVSHLLWSASSRHVRDVWVAGRQVVGDGICLTVDESRAREEVQRRAVRLAALGG